MTEPVDVYPPEGETYPDAAGVPITAAGARVFQSKYTKDALRAQHLFTWDPYGVYQPDDRTQGGGSGGDMPGYATAALLAPVIGTASGTLAFTHGALAQGDGGGGQWYWEIGASDTSDGATCVGASGAGRWKRVNVDEVDVRWFGAKGDNSQTLLSTSYTIGCPALKTVTQQTADGIAINAAIRFIKSRGRGTLYIPQGTYRIYAALESLDVAMAGSASTYNDIAVRGDGVGVTVLKSCDASPVNAHGFGILQAGDGLANVYPASRVTKVALSDFTLDGNATIRNITSGEWWSDNLIMCGWPNATIDRVESINAVRDCVLLNFEGFHAAAGVPANTSRIKQGCKISSCNFDLSWRNTLTIASGGSVQVSDCHISGGGRINSGTLPRSCMDIEPDASNHPILDITFTNCIFTDAPGQLVNVVWSQARFVGCSFTNVPPFASIHWPLIAVSSQVDFVGCTFRDESEHNSYLWYYPGYGTGEFADTEYMNVRSCSFNGCGFLGQGFNMTLESCEFVNSLYPVLFQESTSPVRNIVVRDVNLINVVDKLNAGSGPMAAFAVHQTITCPVYIDGITSRFDPERAYPGVNYTTNNGSSLVVAHGACIAPTPDATSEVKVMNVHCAGWYRKYTSYTGTALSGFRSDWGGSGGGDPGDAPADTSGTGAGPGAIFYKNCTLYGNVP